MNNINVRPDIFTEFPYKHNITKPKFKFSDHVRISRYEIIFSNVRNQS